MERFDTLYACDALICQFLSNIIGVSYTVLLVACSVSSEQYDENETKTQYLN